MSVHITFVKISGSLAKKWLVLDSRGVEHSYKRNRADAEALAKSLPAYGIFSNEAKHG